MTESTRKLHDAIVGLTMTAATVLGFHVNPLFFWVPGIVGALMFQSTFTGFCPVYFTLSLCGYN